MIKLMIQDTNTYSLTSDRRQHETIVLERALICSSSSSSSDYQCRAYDANLIWKLSRGARGYRLQEGQFLDLARSGALLSVVWVHLLIRWRRSHRLLLLYRLVDMQMAHTATAAHMRSQLRKQF